MDTRTDVTSTRNCIRRRVTEVIVWIVERIAMVPIANGVGKIIINVLKMIIASRATATRLVNIIKINIYLLMTKY